MRALHRDLGYLMIGLTLIYALSGIVLIYRDTDFMKTEKQLAKTVKPGLSGDELAGELKIRGLKIARSDNQMLYFNNGNYNAETGKVIYTVQEIRFPFNKFIEFHKSISSNGIHFLAVIYGVVLLFLVFSSFWMYKRGTKNFKRSLVLTGMGIILAVIVCLLI